MLCREVLKNLEATLKEAVRREAWKSPEAREEEGSKPGQEGPNEKKAAMQVMKAMKLATVEKTSMKAMKKTFMKAMQQKSMKAMKNTVATGKRAKWLVYHGFKEKTKGGLTRWDQKKNKRAKIVSRVRSAIGSSHGRSNL